MKLPALLASLAAIVALFLASSASASIHSYDNDYFYSVGDAYIFRGGREGLYASTKEVRFLAWLVGGGEREQARKRKELRDVVVVPRVLAVHLVQLILDYRQAFPLESVP